MLPLEFCFTCIWGNVFTYWNSQAAYFRFFPHCNNVTLLKFKLGVPNMLDLAHGTMLKLKSNKSAQMSFTKLVDLRPHPESQHYPQLSCSTVFLVFLLNSISCIFARQYFLYFCSTVFLPTFLLCLSCLLFWMLLPLPVWEGWWNEPHHNQRIIF